MIRISLILDAAQIEALAALRRRRESARRRSRDTRATAHALHEREGTLFETPAPVAGAHK